MAYRPARATDALRAAVRGAPDRGFWRHVARAAADWDFETGPIERVSLESLVTEPLEPVLSLTPNTWGDTPIVDQLALAILVRRCHPKVLFEFGTFTGAGTVQLAMNAAPDAVVHTLDLAPATRATTEGLRWEREIDDDVIGHVWRSSAVAGRIVQHFNDSRIFDTSELRSSVEFVFIDAGHTYELVRNDTERLFGKFVQVGGQIAARRVVVCHIMNSMDSDPVVSAQTWRTTHGDMTDEEWELIADLVAPCWKPGGMGRPVTVDRRRVVDAIFYVAATGCQWRALPAEYPNWNTVHRYHLTWSRDGTWEAIAQRLAGAVREREGRDAQPSAGIIDARTVRGASTVTGDTRGYDAGKKISGRKTFGIVDTLGLLLAVAVVAANTSDNAGGIETVDLARDRSGRFRKLWCDAGFKKTFIEHCRSHHVAAEVVNRIHPGRFVALPKRWIVERTWSWLMNSRRLQVDYERDPIVTEGFIWAAHSRYLLRRLTQPSKRDRAGKTIATASEKALEMIRPGGTIAWHDYARQVPDVPQYLGEIRDLMQVRAIANTSIAFGIAPRTD